MSANLHTPRALPTSSGLTLKIAAKANAGATAWCQDTVYRPSSMPWPTYLARQLRDWTAT
ncbi:hypothetical protein ACWEQ1_34120 [Streptomyces nodosus]